MNHFTLDCPTRLANIAKKMIERVDLKEFLPYWRDSYGDSQIEPISGKCFESFWPAQLGGFCKTMFISEPVSSGSYMTKQEREWHQSQDPESEFEPVLLMFQIWVTMDEKIHWRLSINYADSPYYRESASEIIKEKKL
jgi:hypothetical protein